MSCGTDAIADGRLLAATAHRPKTHKELMAAAQELRKCGMRVDDLARALGIGRLAAARLMVERDRT